MLHLTDAEMGVHCYSDLNQGIFAPAACLPPQALLEAIQELWYM